MRVYCVLEFRRFLFQFSYLRDMVPFLVDEGGLSMIREWYLTLYTLIYTMPLAESAMYAYLLTTYNIQFRTNRCNIELCTF